MVKHRRWVSLVVQEWYVQHGGSALKDHVPQFPLLTQGRLSAAPHFQSCTAYEADHLAEHCGSQKRPVPSRFLALFMRWSGAREIWETERYVSCSCQSGSAGFGIAIRVTVQNGSDACAKAELCEKRELKYSRHRWQLFACTWSKGDLCTPQPSTVECRCSAQEYTKARRYAGSSDSHISQIGGLKRWWRLAILSGVNCCRRLSRDGYRGLLRVGDEC